MQLGIKRKRFECKGCLLSDCNKYQLCIDKPKIAGPGKNAVLYGSVKEM